MNPTCNCGLEAKLLEVKKDGPNRGKKFYACPRPKGEQCEYFEWADNSKNAPQGTAITPLGKELEEINRKLDSLLRGMKQIYDYIRETDAKVDDGEKPY